MNLSEIDVFDDFLSGELIESLFDISRRTKWSFGWQSRPIGDRFSYWHHHFCGGTIKEKETCLPELFGNPELKPLLDMWNFSSQNISRLEGYFPSRIYANAHTFGNESYLHKDSDKADDSLTLLFYAHPIWAANWGGETVFFNDSYDSTVASVYPRPGRLILFPGHIPHVARSPSREGTELRITFVYKLNKEV